MPAGKARYMKSGREDYVFNRSAPAIATLPRATKDLVVAYRIFSPGLDTVTKLDQIAADVSYSIDNGMCGDLMRDLRIGSRSELRELYKESYAAYAAEIKRMSDEEEAEAIKLANELAAREAREQAREQQKDTLESTEKNNGDKSNTMRIPNQKKRCRVDEPTTPSPTKRPRFSQSSDLIPDPYWLCKDDAQAILDAMDIRVKNLEASLTRLQSFYQDTFINAEVTPDPAISALLARADTQIRQDAAWYVEELQRTMAGIPSTELGVTAGWAWTRDRFDNAAVRGLIERIREFNARLVDTEKEMEEADRLREEFVQSCAAKSGVVEAMGEMFLEDWAKQLLRVTTTVAHQARDYVSFRTMEAERADKWAQRDAGDKMDDRSSPIVIDSSDSDDDDSLSDDSEDDDLEDDDEQ